MFLFSSYDKYTVGCVLRYIRPSSFETTKKKRKVNIWYTNPVLPPTYIHVWFFFLIKNIFIRICPDTFEQKSKPWFINNRFRWYLIKWIDFNLKYSLIYLHEEKKKLILNRMTTYDTKYTNRRQEIKERKIVLLIILLDYRARWDEEVRVE